MVRGIATDNKKYKHKNRNDEKWLCEDLYVYRKTVEKYIDNLRPKDEEETAKSLKKKKEMTLDRIIAILILGIFGSITVIFGIYMIIKGIYIIGVPSGVFGAIFVISFLLFEKYRWQ